MLKICHFSDLHIRNNSRLLEYREVMNEFYQFIQHNKVDILLFTGDWGHTKSVISPEFVDISTEIIKKLSELVKWFYIIPGNHDINEKNKNRIDSISPIVKALELDNVIIFTESCVHNVPDTNITFINFSILDNNRNLNIPNDRFNIGLFHGIINGATNHQNFVLTGDKVEFKPCHVFMLGDVHKRQKLTILGSPAWYAGSLIQQDHSESLEKGGILYTISDKLESVDFFNLKNNYKFIDVHVDDLNEEVFKTTNKVRIVGSLQKVSEARKKLEHENVSFKVTDSSTDSTTQDASEMVSLNFQNIEKIIKENYSDYIEHYGDELLQLNKKYLSSISSMTNNNIWKIKEVSWSNLFSYGENIRINFEKDKGKIIGIFGKNKTGKSSVIDAITFAIYGEWTKRSVNNDVYINTLKNNANSSIKILMGSDEYEITRTIKRTSKGSSSTVLLQKNGKNVCEDDKRLTELEISRIFGHLNNFLLTTILKQYDDVSFLKKKSQHRKEILNTFLGLDELIPVQDKVSADLKIATDKYKENNTLFNSYNKQLEEYGENHLSDLQVRLLEIDKNIEDERIKYLDFKLKMDTIQKIEDNNFKIQKISIFKENISLNKINLDKKVEFLKTEIERINDENSIFPKRKQVKELIAKLSDMETRLKNLVKNTEILNNVPCNNSFPTCKFLVAANEQLINKDKLENEITQLKTTLNDNYKDILIDINKQYAEESPYYLRDIESEIKNFKSNIEKLNKDLKEIESSIDTNLLENTDLLNQKQIIRNNLDIIISKGSSLKKDKEFVQHKINEYQTLLSKVDSFKVSNEILEKNMNILSAYSKIMGKNGVIVHILNSYMNNIKDNVNILLSQASDLEIDLKIDDSKFEINFKDSSSDQFRPIECASGMEEFTLGLSLRLALNKVSMITKNSLIILDEPGTSLDIDNQKLFGDTLVNLLGDFENIIIVTHLEILKDYVSKVLNIKKDGAFSYLEE